MKVGLISKFPWSEIRFNVENQVDPKMVHLNFAPRTGAPQLKGRLYESD